MLGPLEVRLDAGSVLAPRAPKMQALLVALALEPGRSVSTEALVEAVWEQDPPAAPVGPLRSYVSNLRRLLGDEGDRVIATGRGYRLDVAPEAVDALAFERLVARGRQARRDHQPAAAVAQLDEALAMWRGPALDGVGERDFARPTVARLEELRATATEDRLEALWQLGHHEEVVAEVEALVASHPLRERPRRLLMLALHAAGRTADALAAHHRFRGELAEALGLDPSPELDRLAERILQQDPTLVPPTPTVPSTPATSQAVAPVGRARRSLGLVGRERELGQLVQAVQALRGGAGTVVLLAGEPGIGKSALLHELEAHAARVGVPVAWGRCVETGGAPAFWPWTQVLRAVVDRLDDEALADATSGPASAVGHLVPDVAARTGRAPVVVGSDAASSRFALHDAATTFLRRAARRDGLVVVLDDLHWGDPASCELAAFLGTHLPDVPLLLAVSHRTIRADRTPELDEALDALLRGPATRHLELAGLSISEVAELVEGVLERPPGGDQVRDIHDRSGGNPFFAHQLAQLLAESDTTAGDPPEELPRGIRHVILHRLHRIPEGSRETLEAAAVLGRDIDARLVAECTGRPIGQVMHDLDAGAAHGLVTAPSRPDAGYRFLHALVREAIDRELPAGRALALHLAAADALESLPRPPADAVAEHLWQACSLAPVERVVHWSCRAAEDAVAVFAHDQGERILRRALRLLITTRSPAPSLELTVRLRLVQILTSLRGWTSDEIGEVAAPARELANETGIGAERLSLWWSLWTLYTTRGDLAESRSLAQQLLDDAYRLGRPESLVAGHVAVGYTAMFTGAPSSVVHEHLARASAAEDRAEPAMLATTPEHLAVAQRVSSAMAYALDGEHDAACQGMDDAVAVARGLNSPFAEAYARMFAAWGASVVDDADVAWEHAEAGMQVCEVAGLGYLATMITPAHAWAAATRGDDAVTAATRLREATGVLAGAGHRHALAFWQLLLADVLALAGDEAASHTVAEQAMALADEIGERVDGPLVRRVVASADATAGPGPVGLAGSTSP